MLNTAFSPWPCFTAEEASAVSQVLLSNKVNYWTGNEVKLFEKEFAEWVGVRYAIALSNGTVAIELALRALGVREGDEVIVTCRSFFASASCIVNVGAVPVFADVELDSQNISAQTIKPLMSSKTKVIICVHLAGWPCDMDPILELASQHGVYVIEDCAQAHGAKYKGRAVGGIGHIAAWSFCQDKIMTTGGEGGMVTTNNTDWWSFMWSYKDHGKSWQGVYEKKHPEDFRWVHESFGTNYRMTEMQAILGRIQLTRVAQWHEKRINNANRIWDSVKSFKGVRAPLLPDFMEHAAYKCYIFIETTFLNPNWSRNKIVNEINKLGVPCYTGSCPEMYLEKAFVDSNLAPKERLPNAKHLGETSLMFLVHPTLTDEEIDTTSRVITDVLQKALIQS